MKDLNFQPAKSKEDFRNNYKLHDLAEYHGKNLLLQWGIDFKDFGSDRRYEKVWEKGKDKPDLAAEYNNKQFLIDWKGKSKDGFLVNKRAVESYITWSKKLNLPALICFFVFDQYNQINDRRFALLSTHQYDVIDDKAWDKNDVVKFENNLPKFTRDNLIKFIT